jgi:hypothetical protein
MDESGGGGGTPPDQPPTLTGSGGNGSAQPVMSGGAPVPGQYYFPDPVPIGSGMTFTANMGSGGYTVTSNSWSGGTDYASYTSGIPSNPTLSSQTLGLGPVTDGFGYAFIVGAGSQSFTITDTVTYQNGAHGKSTVTFGSDSPTGSLTNSTLGNQMGGIPQGERGGHYYVYLENIRFEATASTDQWTAGAFMFLQIIDNVYTSATINGNTTYFANNVDYSNQNPPGQNFNGKLHDYSTLAYPFYYSDNPALFYSSFSLPSSSSTPYMTYGSPETFDQPNDDSESATPTMVTATESFSTYLMYNGGSGVWIAIAEADWSWTETATMVNGVLTAPLSSPAAPSMSTPSGAAAFPTWVNSIANYQNQAINPPRNGNPGP